MKENVYSTYFLMTGIPAGIGAKSAGIFVKMNEKLQYSKQCKLRGEYSFFGKALLTNICQYEHYNFEIAFRAKTCMCFIKILRKPLLRRQIHTLLVQWLLSFWFDVITNSNLFMHL